MLATDRRWIGLAIAADIVIYMLQGWRWNLLLRPIVRLPLWRSIQAIYIGLFANEVLPLRSGEVIRCYLLARWHALKFSVVISSAAIERLLDGVWLFLSYYVATRFINLPGPLMAGSRILALVLLVASVLLGIAVLHRGHAKEAVRRSRWGKLLRGVVDGMHSMGRSPSFLLVIVVSFFYLALQVVPIYALFQGYGLDLSFGVAAIVLVVLRLGTVLPQAPGNIGSFQFFTVLGLQLFGISRTEATGYATLLFVVVTVPLWLGGFVALIATRMRLGEIHRDAHETLANNGTVSSKSAPPTDV